MSEDVARLSYFDRLVFMALWGLADREGLLLNKPARIKAEAFPYDDIPHSDIASSLTKLCNNGQIKILSRGDDDVITCIYIVNFKQYQKIHPHEAQSSLACRYMSGNVIECKPEYHAFGISGPSPTDVGGGATPKPVASPAVVMMPVKDGEEPITEADVALWESLYGRIDVRATLNKIVGYWAALPRNKRKTRGGIRKSINTWLAKDDDKAPITAGGKPYDPMKDGFEAEPWK